MFLAFGSFVFSWLCDVTSQQNTFTSLVKRLFTTLSTSKKVKALKDHFHPKTVYKVLQENYGSDSDSGLSESEIAWIEEDLGDNCIQVRTRVKNFRNLQFNESESLPSNLAHPLSTSTPLNPFEQSVNSLQKINEMQSEIEKLKEQIAMMCKTAAFRPEETCSTDFSPVSPTSITTPKTYLLRTAAPPPPPPPPLLRPAPPPPPPPPTSGTSDSSNSKAPKKYISLGDILKQRMASEGGLTGGLKSACAHKPATMADVLKNLNSVKLKPVERSPGGTPLKRSPLPCTTADHQSIIANALKIKFSKINQRSPDIEQKRRSVCSPNWSSPSPPRLFGRHLLKKTGNLLN